jgi:hypothetical protein
MGATKIPIRLSVHRDFTVAKGETTDAGEPVAGTMVIESPPRNGRLEVVRSKRLMIVTGNRQPQILQLCARKGDGQDHRSTSEQGNAISPSEGRALSGKLTRMGKPIAHQAAILAHQAAHTAAHQAASYSKYKASVSIPRNPHPPAPSISGKVSHEEEYSTTGNKPTREVFLPRSLREDCWEHSKTEAHGWLDSPDHMSIPTSRFERATAPARVQDVEVAEASKNDASIAWLDEVPMSSKGDAALDRARKRNVQRLREATASDQKILSKYLPSDISIFFPFGVRGPDDYYQPSRKWVQEVLEVARTICKVPNPPLVRLGMDVEDLNHNTNFLADCDWDLEKLFQQHAGTTVDHGSEFRPVEQLRQIVGQHPGFAYLKKMLTSGFDYHLERELTEQERKSELKAQFDRGNHKSALQNIEEVRALLTGDVRRGFILPIRADAIFNVKRLHLQPGGMVRQLSLKADGSRQPKSRFTHDLSFSITQHDASVNARVDISKHPEMVYGWCLLRLIHYIAALRVRHPDVRILISKFDYADAYKRISQSPRSSAASVICFGDVAYICWRMVFGGSPNPAGFSGFSEMLTDLANEIAMSDYEPEDYTSPTVRESHLSVRETEAANAKFAKAIMPAFEVPTTSNSIRDCFIDDIIDCHLDTDKNRRRAGHIVQMAVHVMSRPHAGEDLEPVPRKPLLGPDKLEAEGRSSERQIVLGWEIRTRDITVALPYDKHLAWREDLVAMIRAAKVSKKELESMIGRLNHASFLIPLSRHFLNELRKKCDPTQQVGHTSRQTVRLNKHEIADLELWLEFLDVARRGISINILTVRTPTRIAWSDSCPFGLGGYSQQGRAWRIRVPCDCPFYGDDTANNVLEFLGMAISIMLLLREAAEDEEEHPCILVLGDNTSAVSWIFRSGRVSRNSFYYPAVKFIARTIASQALQASAQICSQHLAGVTNIVADLLSFEGNCRGTTNPITFDCPPDDILTDRVHKFYSQVVPSGFQIHHLPDEIESFALSVMQIVAKSWTQKGKQRSRRTTGLGGDGNASLVSGEWSTTPSSIRFPARKSDCSWQEDLCPTIEPLTSTHRAKLLQSVRSPWYRRLFETPLAVWHRRSGNVEGPAPSTSRTESMKQGRYTQEFD